MIIIHVMDSIIEILSDGCSSDKIIYLQHWWTVSVMVLFPYIKTNGGENIDSSSSPIS